ncbi:MAG: hypothetical protein EBS11_27890 [Janthinobacterium sp.]|nr:hypothetical protein [Janthinobacterium sp.]
MEGEFADEDGVFHDTQEATEDVEELLARVLRAAVEAASMAKMATARINDMEARASRYANRAETLRATAFAAMDALQRTRIELPDLTASIKQNAPRVVITDETLIPAELTRTTVAPDKTAIKAALANGPVAGAELSNSLPSISIRTR